MNREIVKLENHGTIESGKATPNNRASSTKKRSSSTLATHPRITSIATLKLSGILAPCKNPFGFFLKVYDSPRRTPRNHLFFLVNIYRPVSHITLDANSAFTNHGTSLVNTHHADHESASEI